MGRKAREKSPTGIYHVSFKGDGNRIIFEDDLDRYSMMDSMRYNVEKHEMRLGAWCLMSNHVHFLLDDPQEHMDAAMHALMTSYARRFNRRTGHRGHVFQDRFWSSPIISNAYLIQAIKYIHLNPQRARICSLNDYQWSSHREYLGEGGYIDKAFAEMTFDSIEQYVKYMDDPAPPEYRPTWRIRIDDEDVIPYGNALLQKEFGILRSEVQELPKGRRDAAIRLLRDASFTVEQTQRLTGIGEWTIRKARQRKD